MEISKHRNGATFSMDFTEILAFADALEDYVASYQYGDHFLTEVAADMLAKINDTEVIH